MWDLQLQLIDYLFCINLFLLELFFNILNFLDPVLHNGLLLITNKIYYQFPQNVVFFFAIKFCLSIGFLILIRGGTPRYRYDYLTKLGWLKFLGFIILVFFSSLLLFLLF